MHIPIKVGHTIYFAVLVYATRAAFHSLKKTQVFLLQMHSYEKEMHLQLQLTTVACERKFISLSSLTAASNLYARCSSYALFLTVYIERCILLAHRSPLSRVLLRLSPCGITTLRLLSWRSALSIVSHRQAIQLSRCVWRKKIATGGESINRLLQ